MIEIDGVRKKWRPATTLPKAFQTWARATCFSRQPRVKWFNFPYWFLSVEKWEKFDSISHCPEIMATAGGWPGWC